MWEASTHASLGSKPPRTSSLYRHRRTSSVAAVPSCSNWAAVMDPPRIGDLLMGLCQMWRRRTLTTGRDCTHSKVVPGWRITIADTSDGDERALRSWAVSGVVVTVERRATW